MVDRGFAVAPASCLGEQKECLQTWGTSALFVNLLLQLIPRGVLSKQEIKDSRGTLQVLDPEDKLLGGVNGSRAGKGRWGKGS